MSTDTNTYACPNCGSSDELGFLVKAVNYAPVNPDGEWVGHTEVGDGEVVSIICAGYETNIGPCEWEAPCTSREEGLALLTVKQPPLKVTLHGRLAR